MKSKSESTSLTLARSIAMGVLLTLLFFYGIHVFGEWQVEDYRPDPETTSTVLLHNKCAILGSTHTLRPNTNVSMMGSGIDGTKLGGSFMNFTDGHIAAMLIVSLLLGWPVFLIRNKLKKRQQSNEYKVGHD
ncbi:MAG: hypothetical protein ABIN36_08075 [Ferruginibacter sp.]